MPYCAQYCIWVCVLCVFECVCVRVRVRVRVRARVRMRVRVRVCVCFGQDPIRQRYMTPDRC